MIDRHVELPRSFRPRKADAKRIRDVDGQSHIEVTLTLRGPELPDANHLPAERLTPEQFAAAYSSSPQDADTVAQVLKRFGLHVDEVSLMTHTMRVSGSAAAMEAAFPSGLGIYESASQGQFRGREGSIQIPLELSGIVTGVIGLDQRQVAKRAKRTASKPGVAVAEPTAVRQPVEPLSHVGPADIEQRYALPPGTGEGQTIAIAEFGGGYFPDDLAAFCAKYGRPVPNVRLQSVNLSPLTLEQIQQLPPDEQQQVLGETSEVMMDVQIVASLCPKADLVMYFATFDQKGWVDLLNQVVAGNPALPVSLSISWGLAEDSPDWSAQARDAINMSLNAAALLGITVCVASGDDGSGAQMTGKQAHVTFPSSSPFVLSVGGTMLTGTTAAAEETAWWESPGRRTLKGGGATGGGVSVVFPRPQWQSVHVQSLNPGSIDGRVLPDVAALAGPPLYDLILLDQPAPNGGTSASTPVWAALIARINANLPAAKQQRFLTPLLYQSGQNGQPHGQTVCRDITVGKNVSRPWPGVGYKAATGYDAVTGWGVPNGSALLSALALP